MSCSQVPYFLFVVFVVYTLLPFSTRGAVVVGVLSSISHLLVLGVLEGVVAMPSVHVGLQVRGAWAEGSEAHGGELVPRPHSHVCRQVASRTGLRYPRGSAPHSIPGSRASFLGAGHGSTCA